MEGAGARRLRVGCGETQDRPRSSVQERLRAESISSMRVNLTRGRPWARPRRTSIASSLASRRRRSSSAGAGGPALAAASGWAGSRCGRRPGPRTCTRRSRAASGLFVPITPVGPRLIQPARSRPDRLLRLGIEHAALVVQNHAPALVEGTPGSGDAAVADRAEDEPRRQLLELVRGPRLRARREVAASSRLAHELDRRHAPAASPISSTGETRKRR